MPEEASLEDHVRAFERVRPLYERLVDETTDILKTTLRDRLTPIFSARAKAPDSFRDKIKRKNYNDPLREMSDMAGCRVVCEYEAEIPVVKQTIESEFDVLEFVDKSQNLGVDKMGYHGLAYVVSLGDRYAGGRYEGITRLRCEIQVRTVLQDAWAQISHQLVYKNEKSVPERFHRDLNNVAALLEIAQQIFDGLRLKRATYISEIAEKKSNREEFLDQRVDFDTLIEYSSWRFPGLPSSPGITSILLRDLNAEKYINLRSIDEAVNKAAKAVEAYRKTNPTVFTFATDFITKSLGFVDTDFRKRHGFAAPTRQAFEKFSHLCMP